MSEINEIDYTLGSAEVQEILGFNRNEVNAFMRRFGHRTGFHGVYKLGTRELALLRLDGTLADWVKKFCAPHRQTVSARKGKE